jgi:GNAT superfamily N-acetyltransferase
MPEFSFHPLTTDRWADFEALFGPRGACAGCWCMWWRLKRSDFDRQRGEENHLALRALVDGGDIPGLLAFDGNKAAGWCAVQPRNAYPALARSRILQPVDDAPVWSVPCFFIAKSYRRQGLTVQLLRAAIEHVRALGGTLVEGYPEDPPVGKELPVVFAFTGLAAAFREVGFVEVARRSPTRPVMRFQIV